MFPRFHFHTPPQCVVLVSEAARIQWDPRADVQSGEFLGIGPLSDFPRGNDLCGTLKAVQAHAADNFPTVGVRGLVAQSELVTPFGRRQKGCDAV